MPIDFRASNIQTQKIIASGSIASSGRSQIAIYPIESQDTGSPNQGQIISPLLEKIQSSDVFLFVSGAIGSKDSSNAGVAVFGGDLHISGNLTIDGSGGGGGTAGTSQRTVTQNSHGFSLTNLIPIPVYWDSIGSEWVVADQSPTQRTKQAFIVEIIDTNTFVVQLHGYHSLTPGHGLNNGEYYWLDSNSPFYSATQPNTGVAQCLWVVEADRLQLLNQPPYATTSSISPGDIGAMGLLMPPILLSSDTVLSDAYSGNNIFTDTSVGIRTHTLPGTVSSGWQGTFIREGANDLIISGSGGMVLSGPAAVGGTVTIGIDDGGVSVICRSSTKAWCVGVIS